MKIQLSDHFSYKRLLRFVAPSILMLLCTSVYSIVDGFFVSNYVGKTPFAALNLVMPVLMGVGTLGFMAGTGGSAVVSMTLGEVYTHFPSRKTGIISSRSVNWRCQSWWDSSVLHWHRRSHWHWGLTENWKRTACVIPESCFCPPRHLLCSICSRAFLSQRRSRL